MEAALLEDQLHMMQHKPLIVQDYANVYAAIHHDGASDKTEFLKSEMISTIFSQYHVS